MLKTTILFLSIFLALSQYGYSSILLPGSTSNSTISSSVTQLSNTFVSNNSSLSNPTDIATFAQLTSGARTTTSYINLESDIINEITGNINIEYGWSSNTNGSGTLARVSNNLVWSYSFIPIYDGEFLVSYAREISGSNTGINGLTVQNNYGDSQTLNNNSNIVFPLLGGTNYTFSFIINDIRQGSNGLNISSNIASTISWVIVPEPSLNILIYGIIPLGLILYYKTKNRT
jgi:hypothetical protein